MATLDQLIVWAIVGLIGGSLAGRLYTWDKQGLGRVRNLALGLAGAVIGGLLFRIFGILPDLDRISISLRDVVAAVVGAFLVLASLWLWTKYSAKAL